MIINGNLLLFHIWIQIIPLIPTYLITILDSSNDTHPSLTLNLITLWWFNIAMEITMFNSFKYT